MKAKTYKKAYNKISKNLKKLRRLARLRGLNNPSARNQLIKEAKKVAAENLAISRSIVHDHEAQIKALETRYR
jgi:hypothetical protein